MREQIKEMRSRIKDCLGKLNPDDHAVLFNSDAATLLELSIRKFPHSYRWIMDFALKHRLNLSDAWKWNILSFLDDDAADRWFALLKEEYFHYAKSGIISSLFANIVQGIPPEEAESWARRVFPALLLGKIPCFIRLLCYKIYGEESLHSPLSEYIGFLADCLEEDVLGNPEKYLPLVEKGVADTVHKTIDMIRGLMEINHPLLPKNPKYFNKMVKNTWLNKQHNGDDAVRAVKMFLMVVGKDLDSRSFPDVLDAIGESAYLLESSMVYAIVAWKGLKPLLGHDGLNGLMNPHYLHINGLFDLERVGRVSSGKIPLSALFRPDEMQTYPVENWNKI